MKNMGLFDKISKKAKETVAAAQSTVESTVNTVKEKSIGELADSVKKAGSDMVDFTTEFVSTKATELKTGSSDHAGCG